MADVLPSLQKLKVINFGDCLVRSEGAREIAAAVKDGHQQLEVCGVILKGIVKSMSHYYRKSI